VIRGNSSDLAGSSRAAGVRLQEPTKFGGADDLAHLECGLRTRWFLACGRQVVAGAVRSFLVVPSLSFADQMVQVPLSHNYEVVQDLLLQRLDDSRSTWARRFGDQGVLRLIRAPPDFSTSSN
jgi:hypothetical protein